MRRFSLLTLALTWLVGCAQILDIEERQSVTESVMIPDGGTAASASCEQYCTQAMQLCTADGQAALFDTMEGCLGVCQEYQAGSPATPTGNTLACRLDKLKLVSQLGEPNNSCPPAGLGGAAVDPADTAGSCATNCEGYCSVYQRVCPDFPIVDCVNRCRGVPDKLRLNAKADYMSGADSLQCRMTHLSAAAAAKLVANDSQRRTHCGHSGLLSSAQCDLTDAAEAAAPDEQCANYCRTVSVACTDRFRVYEDEAQCIGVCRALTFGKVADKTQNTVRCRREYAYQALTSTQPTSCHTAGPLAGLCGRGKCESYCQLAQKACGPQFALRYGANIAQCESDCSKLRDSGNNDPFAIMNPEAQKSSSLQCRGLMIEKILGGDKRPILCEAAFGAPDTDCK